MSILGLICVLLALVATLLFVLFLFQRRDLRAISELSLTVQRAISGERLPQRIEIDSEFEAQLDVQALGVSVNQLLLRAARTAGRDESRAETLHRTRRAHPRSGARASRRDPVRQQPVREFRRRRPRRISSTASSRTWWRRNTRTWSPRTCGAVSPGAHGAERFEVEMVGLQGQVSLLELTTAQIEFEGAAGAAGDRRRGHPDEEAARARQRQDRREGSRGARRDGRAAVAAAARRRRCRCSPCSRWARPSSPRTSKAGSSI